MPLERQTLYDDGLVRIVHVKGEGEIPEHIHEDAVEVVLLIDGKSIVRIGDREVLLAPFTVTRIEPRVKHSAWLSGEAIAIFIKEEAFKPGQGGSG